MPFGISWAAIFFALGFFALGFSVGGIWGLCLTKKNRCAWNRRVRPGQEPPTNAGP